MLHILVQNDTGIIQERMEHRVDSVAEMAAMVAYRLMPKLPKGARADITTDGKRAIQFRYDDLKHTKFDIWKV